MSYLSVRENIRLEDTFSLISRARFQMSIQSLSSVQAGMVLISGVALAVISATISDFNYITLMLKRFDMMEKVFSVIGYIPYMGTVSAEARSIFASVELVASLALAIFCIINPVSPLHWQLAGIFLKHGLLNEGRSWLESVPFVSLFTCLPYDLFFGPMTYSIEKGLTNAPCLMKSMMLQPRLFKA